MSTATLELEPMHASDMDSSLELSPVVMPAQTRQKAAEPAAQVPPTPHSRARSRLLAMADGYFRSGSLCQALEMYFDLMSGYPDTIEGQQAEERILEVAYRHEQAGEMRLARSIYERLV